MLPVVMNSNQRDGKWEELGPSCGKSGQIFIKTEQIFWKWNRLQSIFPGVKAREYMVKTIAVNLSTLAAG